jgi:hypothetical protein
MVATIGCEGKTSKPLKKCRLVMKLPDSGKVISGDWSSCPVVELASQIMYDNTDMYDLKLWTEETHLVKNKWSAPVIHTPIVTVPSDFTVDWDEI